MHLESEAWPARPVRLSIVPWARAVDDVTAMSSAARTPGKLPVARCSCTAVGRT